MTKGPLPIQYIVVIVADQSSKMAATINGSIQFAVSSLNRLKFHVSGCTIS